MKSVSEGNKMKRDVLVDIKDNSKSVGNLVSGNDLAADV